MPTVTPKFRVSYPNVFKARRNDMSGKDEYSVMALFPKGADMTQLQQAAEKAVIDKWGADKSKWPARLRTPFRNQSEKAKRDAQGELTFPPGHEDGGIFVNIKTSKKPAVVDESVQPITDLEQQKFYAGCWAIAAVNAYAYDNKGNAGVAFGLESLQKVADGDPLGGRTAPEDVFAPIATEAPAAAGQSAGASDAGSIFN